VSVFVNFINIWCPGDRNN